MTSAAFSSHFTTDAGFTADQVRVMERIRALAKLHYNEAASGCLIQPRLWPLLVGPTGSGKTFLCRRLAQQLDAFYLRVSYGGWVVQGARSATTLFSILDVCVYAERIVLHLDELDKFPTNGDSDWSQAVANEVWALLDGELPYQRFCADAEAQARHPVEKMTRLWSNRRHSKIFVVGSGTWQDLFDAESDGANAFGFGAATMRPPPNGDVLGKLARTRGRMSELLARFEGSVQLIRPPGLDEALRILERTGARAYAQEVNYDVTRALRTLLPRLGFRALESVTTELLLLGWRPAGGQEAASAPAKSDAAPGPVPLPPSQTEIPL